MNIVLCYCVWYLLLSLYFDEPVHTALCYAYVFYVKFQCWYNVVWIVSSQEIGYSLYTLLWNNQVPKATKVLQSISHKKSTMFTYVKFPGEQAPVQSDPVWMIVWTCAVRTNYLWPASIMIVSNFRISAWHFKNSS